MSLRKKHRYWKVLMASLKFVFEKIDISTMSLSARTNSSMSDVVMYESAERPFRTHSCFFSFSLLLKKLKSMKT